MWEGFLGGNLWKWKIFFVGRVDVGGGVNRIRCRERGGKE